MSVAIVGGAAIGLAGTLYSSNKASKAAKKAGKRADKADAARMAFEKEQFDEWQNTYGPIEDSVASYYNSLTPTMRITQGLEAHEKEMTRAKKQLEQTMIQKGISTGGLTEQTQSQMAVDSAEERARIRAAAPMEVAKEKLGFLKVGLERDPNEGMRGALESQQTRAQGIEDTTAKNAGEATGAVIDAATNLAQAGATRYAQYKAANPSVSRDPKVTGTGQ